MRNNLNYHFLEYHTLSGIDPNKVYEDFFFNSGYGNGNLRIEQNIFLCSIKEQFI